MTSLPKSQCSVCVHFKSPLDEPRRVDPFCDAFTDRIPDAVLSNQLDHREPISGDHGIRWTSDGRPHP